MALRRFKLGSREIDLDTREVRDAHGVTPLTANEVGLLTVLADRAGQVVDRQQLLVEGLGYRKALQTRAIDQAIWRLRKKIEDEPERPVHLRSEQNVGYWLVLSPDRGMHLAGRRAELATLEQWLGEVSEVWVVGPPGMGRRTLAARIDPPLGAVHVASRMPDDPTLRVLRLGLLSDEDAAELLVDRVLSRRGTTTLGAGEAAAVDELVREVGGWPAALGALADQAVIHTLPELARLRPLPVPVLPALVDFVRTWPEPIRAVASAVAVCPHPVPAADLAETVGADLVVAAWRACAVEAVHRDGGRWFGVPAPMRRALEVAGASPAAAVVERLVVQLVATATGLARTAFEEGSAEVRRALLAREPLTRWLIARTRDPKLLEVLLVTPAPDAGPIVLPPLPDPGDDVDAVVARELLLAHAAALNDPVASEDRVLAAARHQPSPGVERWLAQRVAAALFRRHAPEADLDAAVERVRLACDRTQHPHARSVYLVSRAMLHTRRDRVDDAAADLVEALRLEEAQGSTARSGHPREPRGAGARRRPVRGGGRLARAGRRQRRVGSRRAHRGQPPRAVRDVAVQRRSGRGGRAPVRPARRVGRPAARGRGPPGRDRDAGRAPAARGGAAAPVPRRAGRTRRAAGAADGLGAPAPGRRRRRGAVVRGRVAPVRRGPVAAAVHRGRGGRRSGAGRGRGGAAGGGAGGGPALVAAGAGARGAVGAVGEGRGAGRGRHGRDRAV